MDKNCNESEGARLLETMRRICAATGCEEIEHATLAYEETLQEETTRSARERLSKQGRFVAKKA